MKTFAEVQREFLGIPAEHWKQMETEQGEAWIARTEYSAHRNTPGHPERHGGSWVLYMADGAKAPLHDHLVVEGYEYSEHADVFDGDALYGWDPRDPRKPLHAGGNAALTGPARHQPYVLPGEYVVVRFPVPAAARSCSSIRTRRIHALVSTDRRCSVNFSIARDNTHPRTNHLGVFFIPFRIFFELFYCLI